MRQRRPSETTTTRASAARQHTADVMARVAVLLGLQGLSVSEARPPDPRVPGRQRPEAAKSEVLLSVPRLDALDGGQAFAARAGAHSSLFRPETWRANTFPLLGLDPTDSAALGRAGIDGAGALRVLHRDGVELHCLGATEPRRVMEALGAALHRRGEQESAHAADDTTTVLSRDVLGRVLAAAATRGRTVCTMTGSGGASLEPRLADLQDAARGGLSEPRCATGRRPAVPPLAAVSLDTPEASGCLEVSLKELSLTMSAALQRPRLPALADPGPSPFATLQPPGVGTLRARLRPDGVRELLAEVALLLPDELGLDPLLRALASDATGNASFMVHSVRPSPNLRTPEGRLFALRFAFLLEVADAERAAALLAGLDRRRLALRSGTFDVGLHQGVLWLASAPEAAAAALAALPGAAGRQTAALELHVDPKELARGLGAIPLSEALEAPELAPLLWLSLELGPLLAASERITGWANRGPAAAARGGIELALPKAAADAPRPDETSQSPVTGVRR